MAMNLLYRPGELAAHARGRLDGAATRVREGDGVCLLLTTAGLLACAAADEYAREHPDVFASRAEWSAYADGWFLAFQGNGNAV